MNNDLHFGIDMKNQGFCREDVEKLLMQPPLPYDRTHESTPPGVNPRTQMIPPVYWLNSHARSRLARMRATASRKVKKLMTTLQREGQEERFILAAVLEAKRNNKRK